MPSVTTRKTRQRSSTPTTKVAFKSQEVELTPGWTSGNPNLFKEPLAFSPLKTRPSTRRQSLYIRSQQNPIKPSKKSVSARTKVTATKMTKESEPTQKLTRTRSGTPSRESEPSGSASKIPVKRETTPSRGRKKTPSRTTRSRSRSRGRQPKSASKLSSPRKTPSSNRRDARKSTPYRQTPSRSTKKRPASPARNVTQEETPVKAAKVLGKNEDASSSTAVGTSVASPATSTPARKTPTRKRPYEMPTSEIRYSKRLAAKGVANTSIAYVESPDKQEEAVAADAEKSGWGLWCTIL